MLPVMFGLLGVVAGCFLTTWLTAYWSKRNWQFQKATETYAQFFVAGRRHIGLLERLELEDAGDSNSLQKIDSSRNELDCVSDNIFLRLVDECWLFEKDGSLRDELDSIRIGFNQYWQYAEDHAIREEISIGAIDSDDLAELERIHRRTFQMQENVGDYNGPFAKELLNQLNNLRDKLANKYFH